MKMVGSEINQYHLQKLRLKYPGSIPILITKSSKLSYNWYCKTSNNTVKLLAPESMSLFDLKLNILSTLKRLNNSVKDNIYLFSGNTPLNCNSVPLSHITQLYGDNGVLYLTIHAENAFG